MNVRTLRLRNFRNYGQQTVDFSGDLNIIFGENAQGKTNILEAIFLCSTGRSHRTQRDAEMVKFGEESAVVEIEAERKNLGSFRIGIEIQRSGRKSISVNGIPQRRAGDLLGRLICAIFSPEDLSVIKDEPQIRRRFVDMFISQIKPAYYFNLHSYLGALRQRNTLLRQSRENPRLLDTVGAWDEQLAEYGSKVMCERIYFIEQIAEFAKQNHALITGGREALDVKYEPSLKISGLAESRGWGGAVNTTCEAENVGDAENIVEADTAGMADTVGTASRHAAERQIRELFVRALEQGLQADVARMSTQCGPHKDDLSCAIAGRSVRLYGSQGQQRTASLALKMAQVDAMALEAGDVPVLLLDDVMSELDQYRRDNLSAHMKNSQTFITGTEPVTPLAEPLAYKSYRVSNGCITVV